MKGIYILLSILMMTTPADTDKTRPYEEDITATQEQHQEQSNYEYIMDLINK